MEMETYQWVITILVGLLGLASGVGLSHLTILKKVNMVLVSQGRTDEKIISLFRNQEDLKADNLQCLKLHRETLNTISLLIQQNTILMERKL